MNPVVQQMVDEMCEETKEDMKAHTFASWKQAVMSADAAWLKKWRQRGKSQQESVAIFMPLKCVAVIIVPIKKSLSVKERIILRGTVVEVGKEHRDYNIIQ